MPAARCVFYAALRGIWLIILLLLCRICGNHSWAYDRHHQTSLWPWQIKYLQTCSSTMEPHFALQVSGPQDLPVLRRFGALGRGGRIFADARVPRHAAPRLRCRPFAVAALRPRSPLQKIARLFSSSPFPLRQKHVPAARGRVVVWFRPLFVPGALGFTCVVSCVLCHGACKR